MYFNKLFFCFVCISMLSVRVVLAVNVGTDTTISADTTAKQTITADNITLINNANINFSGETAIDLGRRSGIIIINNAGASIKANEDVIKCSTDNKTCSGPVTLNNFGLISNTSTASDGLVRLDKATDALIRNHPGGVIQGVGGERDGHHAVDLSTSSTLINGGTIIRIDDGAPGLLNVTSAIGIQGNDVKVILQDDSILVGTINNFTNKTGLKIHVDHGYGRSYMYHTIGAIDELVDLSGNRIVKGSATAVGMGAQETVDELLGLRAYNLRNTLKRYANLQNPKAQIEPFAQVSFRDNGRTTISYDNYTYGTHFIYPVVPDKLNLILTVESNKLKLDEGHSVDKDSFLIGVNTNDFIEIGQLKASAFIAGGVSWHDSSRDVLTNIVITGRDNVTANYETTDAIVGLSFSHTYDQKISESVSNKWETDLGVTLSFSHTPNYSESRFFTWEERDVTQLSVHLGEQLTLLLGDKIEFRLGSEFEHRSVLAGKTQNHAINDVDVDFKSGSFYENSISMNTGFNYSLGEYSKAYIQFNGRVSDQTAVSVGGSVGVNVVF